MNIISVIPLVRSKLTKDLSYFTSQDVPIGAIVNVPLRSKSVHAIVTKIEKAEDLKQNLRRASFEIKKLSRVKANTFFPPAFVDGCLILANYYATNVGAIIDSLVSEVIVDNSASISPPLPKQSSLSLLNSKQVVEDATYAIQADDADRISSWRSLIRQEFAKKRSIAIYVPAIEDCNHFASVLEKGIEGYIFKLNSSLTKKEIISTWEKIRESTHPIVVIATGTFSLLPRGDIDTVIIERENGRGWISQKNPYLDLRHAIEIISRKRQQTVYLADSILQVKTLHRLDSGEVVQGSPFKWRSISTADDELVDMKKTPTSISERVEGQYISNEFHTLSPQLENLIRQNRDESRHLFIYATRRGHSSLTVCDDCGTIVQCNNCSSPVVLHTSQTNKSYFYMCHKCGERRPVDELCLNCGSWRLTSLGIGIDRVYEEIKQKFPDVTVHKIDADTTKTSRQIGDSLEKFRNQPGSILLGTEVAISYLHEKVDNIAVVSLDSLFALPDFRMSERIMYTLIRLRSLASDTILVQTRRAQEPVFEYGLKGNLSDFYRLTISERKDFLYPPFSRLVKITIEGKKEKISDDMATVVKIMSPLEIDIFPAFTATVRGKSVIHGLIKIESHAYPDPEVINKLRALGPNVLVKIDPESLL